MQKLKMQKLKMQKLKMQKLKRKGLAFTCACLVLALVTATALHPGSSMLFASDADPDVTFHPSVEAAPDLGTNLAVQLVDDENGTPVNVVTATGTHAASSGPYLYAIDGDSTGTRYSGNRRNATGGAADNNGTGARTPVTNPVPPWQIEMTFPQTESFNTIRLYEYRERIDQYTISYSNDGTSWTVMKTGQLRAVEVEAASVNNAPPVDIYLGGTYSGSHIRFTVDAVHNANNAPSIWELEVYNVDTTDPEIRPTRAEFDKGAPQNVTVVLDGKDFNFESASVGSTALTAGTEYVYSSGDGTFTLNSSYLSTLEVGVYSVTFTFSDDKTATMSLDITDSSLIKFADYYMNQRGDALAVIVPDYEGMSRTVGVPAIINAAATENKFPSYEFLDVKPGTSVAVKLTGPDGTEVYTAQAVAVENNDRITIPDSVVLTEGLYEVQFTLTNGNETLYDPFFFTAIANFDHHKSVRNAQHSFNANVAGTNPDSTENPYPAVYLEDGKLVYVPDFKGNRIMNYADAGYKGGGVAIPNVPVRKVVSPLENDEDDAHPMLQAAIDELATYPLRADGFRGTLYLEEGVYRISAPLYIRTSGIVIRGAGIGEVEAHATPFYLGDKTVPNSSADWEGRARDYIANMAFEAGVTKLIATWTMSGFSTGEGSSLIVVKGNMTSSATNRVDVMDQYVGAGTYELHVSDASGFSVGDRVLVKKKVNEDWARALYMDKVDQGSAGTTVPWDTVIHNFNALSAERTIASIDSVTNKITLNEPLSDNLDRRWGISTVEKYTSSGEVEHVGIENIEGISMFDETSLYDDDREPGGQNYEVRNGVNYSHYRDENHPMVFVFLTDTKNAWVRNFNSYHLDIGVSVSANTSYITVQDGNMLDPVSQIESGSRRYGVTLNTSSKFILTQRMYTRYMRHAYSIGSYTSGPNVFLDSVSDYNAGSSEPHFRWSSGGLFDNVEGRIQVQNRWNAGTSHGWAGVNYVLYNSIGAWTVTQPPLSPNYIIGQTYDHSNFLKYGSVDDTVTGEIRTDGPSANMAAAGLNGGLRPQYQAYTYSMGEAVSPDRVGAPSLPRSIYLQQLKDSKGQAAVDAIASTTVPANIDQTEDPFEGLPLATGIYLDGTLLEGFDSRTTSYTVQIPLDYAYLPVVTAEVPEGSTVNIHVPDNPLSQAIRVEVSNATDTTTYMVNFSGFSKAPIISASTEQSSAGNYAINVLSDQAYNGSTTLRWAGQWVDNAADVTLQMYLGKEPQSIAGLELGFVKHGNNPREYFFNIEYSLDGETWIRLDHEDWTKGSEAQSWFEGDTAPDWTTEQKEHSIALGLAVAEQFNLGDKLTFGILAPESNPNQSEVLKTFTFNEPVEARFIRTIHYGNIGFVSAMTGTNQTDHNGWNNVWRYRPIFENAVPYTPVTGLTLTNAPETMQLNTSATLTAVTQPAEAQVTEVIWSSSDPSIVKISQSGQVTAVGTGTATVTARSIDGVFSGGIIEYKEASVTITVEESASTPSPGPTTPPVNPPSSGSTPAADALIRAISDQLQAARQIEQATDAVRAARSLADALQELSASAAAALADVAIADRAALEQELVETVAASLDMVKQLTERADAANALLALEAIGTAIEHSSALAARMDEAALRTLASNAAGVIQAATTALDQVSAGDSSAALQQVAAIAGQSAEFAIGADAAAASREMVSALSTLIRTTVSVTEQATDLASDTRAVLELTVAVAAITEGVNRAGSEIVIIQNNLSSLAEALIQREGTILLEAQDDKAVIANAEEVVAKAAIIKQTADAINAQMNQSGILRQVESRIVLAVAPGAGDNVVTEVPVELLQGIQATGIDRIEISTGIASLRVTPDFIREAGVGPGAVGAGSVSLGVARVPVSPSLLATLTLEQQEIVGATGGVFQFNASFTDAAGVETSVSKFAGKIEVRIPYTLGAGENPDRLTVLYLGDDGQITNRIGRYDELTGALVFLTDHFSTYLIKNMEKSFTDVASTFWAANEIGSMAAKGIIDGRTGGAFDPESRITRAEFTKMLVLALNLFDENATASFTDVQATDWFAPYIASASQAGIITGVGDGKFAPHAFITRQEMAVLLSRILSEQLPENVEDFLTFADSEAVADWAAKEMALAIKIELIRGMSADTLAPGGNATRAQAATVIYRLFNYMG